MIISQILLIRPKLYLQIYNFFPGFHKKSISEFRCLTHNKEMFNIISKVQRIGRGAGTTSFLHFPTFLFDI